MRLTYPPVIMRTYQDRDPKQAARKFEQDAQGLGRDGYAVARVATYDATTVLSWWAWPAAKAALTVTYVRRQH